MRVHRFDGVDQGVKHVLSEVAFTLLRQADLYHLAKVECHESVQIWESDSGFVEDCDTQVQYGLVLAIFLLLRLQGEAFLGLTEHVEWHIHEPVLVLDGLALRPGCELALIALWVVEDLSERGIVHHNLLALVGHLNERVVEFLIKLLYLHRLLLVDQVEVERFVLVV